MEGLGGELREEWLEGSDAVFDSNSDAVRAYVAWALAPAFERWSAWAGYVPVSTPTRDAVLSEAWQVRAAAVVGLRMLTAAATARRERDRLEVAKQLDRLIARVEKDMARGARHFAAMQRNVQLRVQRASRQTARVLERTERRRGDIRDGRRADDSGHYQFDKILKVTQTKGGAVRYLVRWQGEYDDTWCSYSQICPAYQHVARRWAFAVLGRRIRTASGPGWEPLGTRVAARPMRRLLRAADVGLADTSAVGREHPEAGVEDTAEESDTKRRRVIDDDIDPDELTERRRVERGRGGEGAQSKKKTVGGEPDAATPPNRAGVICPTSHACVCAPVTLRTLSVSPSPPRATCAWSGRLP